MFNNLISSIDETFSDRLPKEICVPCLLRGLAKGFLVGAAIGALIAGMAAIPPAMAIATVIILAAVGAAAMYDLWGKMKTMDDNEKSKVLGQLAGGVVGGGVGARAVSGVLSRAATVEAEPPHPEGFRGSRRSPEGWGEKFRFHAERILT